MLQRVDAVNRPDTAHIRYGWALDTSDWSNLAQEILHRGQWQSRPLGYASKRSVPQLAGVYMMCARPPGVSTMNEPFSSLMEVIYVGKSNNLRRRYAEHLNVPSPKVRMAKLVFSDSLRFWFIRIPTASLSDAERLLIDCFGPPANDKPGEGHPLESGPAELAESNTRR